jgi:hypothetical protein
VLRYIPEEFLVWQYHCGHASTLTHAHDTPPLHITPSILEALNTVLPPKQYLTYLFIYFSVFNDDISSSVYMASNVMMIITHYHTIHYSLLMNNELEMTSVTT